MSRTRSPEGKPSYEEDRERSGGDRASFNNANPEVAQNGDAKIVEASKENGAREGRSREDSEPRRQTNGDAAEQRSPRYSMKEESQMSGSPAARRDTNYNDEEPEDRRGRRRGSRSASPRGQRRSRSNERRDDGPFTQVFVTGYNPREVRKEELEDFFSNKGAFQIVDVVMKSRFAFVEFKVPEDAVEAVRQLHRTEF